MSETDEAVPTTESETQMQNTKTSFSCSCINMDLVLESQTCELGLGHSQSATDSLALQEEPLTSFTAVASDPSANGDDETLVPGKNYVEISEDSALPVLNENTSSGDEVPQLALDYSTKTEPLIGFNYKWGPNYFDPNMDPKKIRRILSNRESAQRSRLRKLQYVDKLKSDLNTEQAKISILSPQVSFYEFQRMILQRENDQMKEKLEALENDKAYKEVEFLALKEERDMLGLAYMSQQQGN